MKKPALIITGLFCLIFALFVVKIFISNNVATSGVILGKIEEEIETYKLENSQIAEKLYTDSSLTNIAKKAYDLGYTETKSDFVITQKLPVAIKQ